jgi:DNA polymerase III epsilon subunit-like protein
MPRFAVFDTETTGFPKPKRVPLSQQPRIIDFGLVIIDGLRPVKEISQLINPEFMLTAEQTKNAGGITNEMLKGQPTFPQYLPTIIDAMYGVDYLIAHNAPFDVGMLGMELNRISTAANKSFPWPKCIICTVQEYYHIFGFRPKLTVLYEHYMKKPLNQTHRALSDAKDLTEVLLESQLLESLL